MNPLCRNSHPKNPTNTYRGRCRLCRAINARRYRAEGREFDAPGRGKKRYSKNREKVLGECRARYHANKKKYCALRRINKLRKRVDLSDGEFLHLAELVRQVSALPTISSGGLPPHPKVRFVRGR